jgi:hypothetical protein
VKIETLADHYRIVFLTDMPTEAAFLDAVEKDIRPCLGANDQLGAPDWPSRSVTLITADLPTFKRNMVFACVMIELG